ncbi:hypothetical protein pb186bvf_019297 [Paramecium bursaria]
MQRKRRCAYDSETLEEYIEISSRDERYYNSKEPSDRKIIQGFEFVNYVDSQNLPPEILQLNREPSEQIFTYYIMMLGSITDQLKSALLSYCQESRKNSLEESDFVSPIKNKLCLDLAIKRILRTNGVHVVKFYIHDISIQTFEQIIKVYFTQTSHYILVINEQSEQKLLTQYIEQRTNNFNTYIIQYSEDSPNSESTCNRWNFAQTLNQIIDQVIDI